MYHLPLPCLLLCLCCLTSGCGPSTQELARREAEAQASKAAADQVRQQAILGALPTAAQSDRQFSEQTEFDGLLLNADWTCQADGQECQVTVSGVEAIPNDERGRAMVRVVSPHLPDAISDEACLALFDEYYTSSMSQSHLIAGYRMLIESSQSGDVCRISAMTGETTQPLLPAAPRPDDS